MTFKDFLIDIDNFLASENIFASYYYSYVNNVFTERKLKYPLLVYHVDGFNHSILENSITNLKFNFFAFDKLKSDNSNVIDVQDDLLKRLIYLQFYLKRVHYATNFTLTAVSDEAYSEKITGWIMNCEVKLDTTNDSCIKEKTLKEKVEDYAKVIKRYSDIDLWLRADWGVVTDSNNKVSRWEDFVHPDYNIIQNVADRRPLLVDNYANTFPALQFDGVNDFLNGGDICDLKLSGTTWFIVCKYNDGNTGSFFAKTNKSSIQKRYGFYASSNFFVFMYHDTSVRQPSILLDTNINLFSIKIKNSYNKLEMYKNNNFVREGENDGAFDMNSDSDFWIGDYYSGNRMPLNGYIMEIIKFDRVLSDSEFAYVHAFNRTIRN